ncbi:cell envelope integrity protein TolA [Lacinutrix iliipiscaria]|uniref:Cell envelope integrity protein TolA n=1 Tax=Lacinutrix iliipiscaria TaxID=1230532 RepID=A0ABW5WR53_9FLAO
MKYLQTKHERNSAKITTLIMLILILLLFVVGQDYKEQPDEYGVAINFNNSAPPTGNMQQVRPEKTEEVVEEVVEEELTEEVVEEEVVEEKELELEETAEEKVEEEIEEAKKEALEAEKILREEAKEAAEKLKSEEEAKQKAEAQAKAEKEEKEAKAAKAKAEKEKADKAAKAAKAKAAREAQIAKDNAAKEAAAKAAEAAKKANEGQGETSFALIENVPIYPGCEGGDNAYRKKCMSDKIKAFITENFDTDLASDLSGIQKINISFKINTSGKVVSIGAYASNPKLEDEAKRVTSMLPKMKPGMQQGKAVVVSYSLPIRIKLED